MVSCKKVSSVDFGKKTFIIILIIDIIKIYKINIESCGHYRATEKNF